MKKNEIKEELAVHVARKVALTKARLAIKAIPFATRTREQHAKMLSLGADASEQKELIRHVQLAYAFVRGVPYWKQERRAKDKPYAISIAHHAGVEVEAVRAWLAAPVSPEERAAFEAHLARAKDQATLNAKLSRLIAQGKGDTDEADSVREALVDARSAS